MSLLHSPDVKGRGAITGIALALCLLAGVLAGAGSALAAGSPSAPAAASASSSAGPQPLPPEFVGVNVNGPVFPAPKAGVDLGSQLALMHADGVQAITVVFSWAFAQPYERWSAVPKPLRKAFAGAGGVPTDFQQTDEIVKLAAEHGITVQPTVIYDPPWAQTHTYLSAPSSDAAYAAYLTALVHRYGPHGSFWRAHRIRREPITQWQIWNEPNSSYFWHQQPFAKTYVPLLEASAKAIRAVDPAGKVVIGGLPNDSWDALASILAVHGAAKAFDIVGVHPYTSTPAAMITILQRVRQVLDSSGGAGKQIAVNEFSWVSDRGETKNLVGFGIDTTPGGQARRIASAIQLLAANRQTLGLSGFDYYSWATNERPGQYGFSYAGLLGYRDGKLTPKPALAAFRRAAFAIQGRR